MFQKRTLLYLFLCLLCMGSIFALSSQNDTKSNALSTNVTTKVVEHTIQYQQAEKTQQAEKVVIYNRLTRNVAHCILFFLLGLSVSLFFRQTPVHVSFLFALAFCVLYAGIDEGYQEFFVEGRGYEFVDLLKDWGGSVAGIFLVTISSFLWGRRKKSE